MPNRVLGAGTKLLLCVCLQTKPRLGKFPTLEGKWASRHEDDTSSWVTCRTSQSSERLPSSRLESCLSFPDDTYPNFTFAAAK